MLARRIIPCLDVMDGRVVKGVQFKNHQDVGDIVGLAQRYRDQGADELVFMTSPPAPKAAQLAQTGCRLYPKFLTSRFVWLAALQPLPPPAHAWRRGPIKYPSTHRLWLARN